MPVELKVELLLLIPAWTWAFVLAHAPPAGVPVNVMTEFGQAIKLPVLTAKAVEVTVNWQVVVQLPYDTVAPTIKVPGPTAFTATVAAEELPTIVQLSPWTLH